MLQDLGRAGTLMVQLFSRKLLLRCSTFCHLCPEWLWGCWQWCPLPPITLLSKPPPFPTTHYLTATILSHKIPTCHILFPKGININNVFWPRRTLSFSNLIWGFGNLNFDFNLFRAYTHTSPGSPHMDRELCWAFHSEGLSLLHQNRKVPVVHWSRTNRVNTQVYKTENMSRFLEFKLVTFRQHVDIKHSAAIFKGAVHLDIFFALNPWQ